MPIATPEVFIEEKEGWTIYYDTDAQVYRAYLNEKETTPEAGTTPQRTYDAVRTFPTSSTLANVENAIVTGAGGGVNIFAILLLIGGGLVVASLFLGNKKKRRGG